GLPRPVARGRVKQWILLEGTERWEASPHQAKYSAEGLNEMPWGTTAARSGLTLLPGSTAGCGKPHVRWCGRVTARNHRGPTRSFWRPPSRNVRTVGPFGRLTGAKRNF